jgi:hypothetical protein
MFNLTNEVASVLAPFQILFVQQRSWQKAQEMLDGNAKFGWACRRHGVSLVC